MNTRCICLLTLILLLLAPGCGSDREIPEPVATADVLYANSIRATLDEMRTAENPTAAANNAQYALEDMEGYEEADWAAEHLETYRQIYQAFQELSQMQGASADEINEKVSALESLAQQLPGADSNAAGGTDEGGGE